MPCYHPLKALARTPPGSTKREIVFPHSDVDYMWSNGHLFNEKLTLPCGQCLGCRLEYSRQWAIRCCFEAKQWKHNYFVTLTYDAEHVPLKPRKVDADTGEVLDTSPVMTLNPNDLTGFLKRLREKFRHNYYHTGIRYFACGEYGPLHSRPHYHLILFNIPLDDLVFQKNENGYSYFRSSIIESAWSDKLGKPLGYVTVTDFSFETAAYVARYMLKKHKGKTASFYEENGILPEFTRCSRRPGIGAQYYVENKSHIYDFDQVVFTKGDGNVLKCQPPKYYDRLFDIECPDDMSIIRDKRKAIAERSMRKQLSFTTLPLEKYLVVKENNKALSIQSLKRNL